MIQNHLINIAIENYFAPYDGIPHVTVGHYVMHCQFGNDHSTSQKEKRRKRKVILLLCFFLPATKSRVKVFVLLIDIL